MIFDILVAAAAGVISAIAILPFSVIALIFFILATLKTFVSRRRSGDARLAIAGFLISGMTYGGIVSAAAWYRPAKAVELALQRHVRLPSTQMTLAELSYTATYDRRTLPIRMSFTFAEDDKDIVVKWPRRDLTVGELLDAIESQTVLRRRFAHCGNGYTVFRGGDCCFGVSLRDPQPSGSLERFDVDAYALIRSAARP